MIFWEKGVVRAIIEDDDQIQRLEVEEESTGYIAQALHYPRLLGWARVGDQVWLNTTAVKMGLGTGGYHFVAGWVERAPEALPTGGHIMKLRYTPWQLAVLAGEEKKSGYHDLMRRATNLDYVPVVIGELHSILPIIVATWQALAKEAGVQPRIVYVMTDGGALPLALSQHVRQLRQMNWLTATVTVGHAFGGDIEAVNPYSGLLLARHALQADLIVVVMGPGIVGTGTPFGYTGVEQGEWINAVHTLGGIPVAVPRIQENDSRERHRGLSHHTITNLNRIALVPAVVPIPADVGELEPLLNQQRQRITRSHHWVSIPLTADEVKQRLSSYPQEIRTMGRSFSDDPLFYISASAAAEAAWRLWKEMQQGISLEKLLSIMAKKGEKNYLSERDKA